MGKISESIWNSKTHVIPMADVSHIEKQYHTCDMANGSKKGDPYQIVIFTKHTTRNVEADGPNNNGDLLVDKLTYP
jgi:galactitol-specific phosphotransferase system IIB component